MVSDIVCVSCLVSQAICRRKQGHILDFSFTTLEIHYLMQVPVRIFESTLVDFEAIFRASLCCTHAGSRINLQSPIPKLASITSFQKRRLKNIFDERTWLGSKNHQNPEI